MGRHGARDASVSGRSADKSAKGGAAVSAVDKYKGVPLAVLERAHKRAAERMRDAQSQAALLARAIKRAKREARHNSENKLQKPIDS